MDIGFIKKEIFFVRLKNNDDGISGLDNVIENYYDKNGGRFVLIFDEKSTSEGGLTYVRYLLDKKHVIEYSIYEDGRTMVGEIALAIGPHYFSPEIFWSPENSVRFKPGIYPNDIEHNLRLLDEFFGYST